MCGRAYATYTDEELKLRYHLRKPFRISPRKPNYNMSPSQECVVIKVIDGEPEAVTHRWGLVPHWAKDIRVGYKMINAKAETIEQKPSFREAFRKRRCICPVSGFYEWKKDESKGKRPFAISHPSDSILSLAAIWETWYPRQTGEDQDKDRDLKQVMPQAVHTFSIVTTDATAEVSSIHDRMPVILDHALEGEWLDPNNQNVTNLKSIIMRSTQVVRLQSYEVTTLVNSPKNNNQALLSPVDPLFKPHAST